jgi:hypothetical protein
MKLSRLLRALRFVQISTNGRSLLCPLTVGPSCVHYWDRFVPQALYRAVSTVHCDTLGSRRTMGPSCVHYRDRNVPVALRISTNDGSLLCPLLVCFVPVALTHLEPTRETLKITATISDGD